MTSSQRQALVSLLQEGDAATVGLVKGKLIEGGHAQLPEYQRLLSLATGLARQSLQEVIYEIEGAKSLGDISRGLARVRTLSQVEDLCWNLTRADHPGFDSGPYVRQLDQWAAEAERLIAPKATPQEKVNCLARYLGQEQGLAGNQDDYYHPRNCYLPWVMEFRRGLPITLTLIYMLVGMRLNIEIEGIGAPGHFLARHSGVVFDPFHGGRTLQDGQWELLAAEVHEKQRHLLAIGSTPLQTMHRLLINLRNCYVKNGDIERCRRMDQYLAVLQR